MKKNSGLKMAIIIISIILISLISFVGIYKQQGGSVKNIMPEYKTSKELNGTRLIVFKVDDSNKEDSTSTGSEEKTSTPVNSKEVLTEDNYVIAKNIIKKRLDQFNIINYDLRLDKSTGKIALEAGEDSTLDDALAYLLSKGNFTITDTDTKEVLLDNSKIKEAKAMYYPDTSGTTVYLDIIFNDEGKSKLEEISKTYVQSTDDEGNKTKKTITIKIDDETITTTYFGQTMSNGELPLTIGSETTDTNKIKNYLVQAGQLAILLNNGVNPIAYTIQTNEYVAPIITSDILNKIIISVIVILALMIIYLIIKNKTVGIIAAISLIGYTALYLLAIRFTDTIVSLEAIASIAISIILEFIFVQAVSMAIRKEPKESKKSINKELIKNIYVQIPLYIMAIVFVFVQWETIKSFGLALFWGLLVSLVYNLVITKYLFIQKADIMISKE